MSFVILYVYIWLLSTCFAVLSLFSEVLFNIFQIYWIGPIAGSLLGGVIYHFLYSKASSKYNSYKASYSSTDYRERESETNL